MRREARVYYQRKQEVVETATSCCNRSYSLWNHFLRGLHVQSHTLENSRLILQRDPYFGPQKFTSSGRAAASPIWPRHNLKRIPSETSAFSAPTEGKQKSQTIVCSSVYFHRVHTWIMTRCESHHCTGPYSQKISKR